MNPTLILIIFGGLGLLLLVVGVGSSLLGGQSVVEERLGRYIEGSRLERIANNACSRPVSRK